MLFWVNGLFKIADKGDNAKDQYQQAKTQYRQASLCE